MKKLYNFNTAYTTVQTFYDIEPNASDFEDIALSAWNKIGNKHTRLYRYIADTNNSELDLPCNVVDIESVHIPINDAQMTSNQTAFEQIDSLFVEGYIDAWKWNTNPLNTRGKFVKYREGDNKLYFDQDYKNVMVVYHGIIADEEGLPLLNEREIEAIAAYVAYIETFKDGLKKRDKNTFALIPVLKEEWLRKCNAARSPEHLSQNDLDSILDVKYRWDRKHYGKSFRPII